MSISVQNFIVRLSKFPIRTYLASVVHEQWCTIIMLCVMFAGKIDHWAIIWAAILDLCELWKYFFF